jgi:hypothetical protein
MDWADEGESPRAGRSSSGEGWREARGDLRGQRRGLDDRLEGWVSRGRDLVDGVSGARPGTRTPGRGGERAGGGGRGPLDGVGRWVEGKLDWLLDDREDWPEPWQEGDRARGGSGEHPERRPPSGGEFRVEASPPARRSRPPLEAISRRGASPAVRSRQPSAPRATPASPDSEGTEARAAGSGASPRPNPTNEPGPTGGPTTGSRSTPSGQPDWPEDDTFTVPRWVRQESSPPRPVDPLAPAPAPIAPPARPLPRSTRRR